MTIRLRVALTAVLLFIVSAPPAFAQDWSIDARDIALGGTGNVRPLVSTMERFEQDTVVVVPFGLVQVLKDVGIYNPKSSHFDPVRAGVYLSSPLHYMRNRDAPASSTDESAAIGPLTDGNLTVGGVFAPRVGRTIPLYHDAADGFQGVYLGAGPYVGVRADANTPDAPAGLSIDGTVDEQLAAALTFGYRGRMTQPSIGLTLDLAIDYSFLRGFLYNRDDFDIDIVTGDIGDIPTAGTGQSTRSRATHGVGRAINLAVGAAYGRWGFGLGVDGLANQIRWTDVHQTGTVTFPLDAPPIDIASPSGDLVISVPVDYRGRVSYSDDNWTVAAGVGHHFGGRTVNAGAERRFGDLALRGGLRYDYGRWSPSAGVGLPLSSRVALDVAAFGTTANLARRRQMAIAVSFHIKSLTPYAR